MHLRYSISPGTIPSTQNVSPNDPPLGGKTAPEQARSNLIGQAARLAGERIDFLLLREPNLNPGELATLAREILLLFANSPTQLLLHSRLDIAAAVEAHGVHLPSNPGALVPSQVRAVYAHARLPRPVVSLSCHTAEDLLSAHEAKPDLILFGPIFGKQVDGTLIHPGIGLEPLRTACALVNPIPVLAIGGVTQANASACIEAGAAGIAAIRLFAYPQLK